MNDPSIATAHSWRFYLTPGEAWEAMYEDCAQAARSIEFEQYIFENDPVGRKFMRLFIQKAAQGVKIFVICDKFGSRSFDGSRLLRLLRRNGGRFYFYNAVFYRDIFMPWRWYPRTHVKTLLVDSTIAYTGGVCLADYMRDWRDTQIRITGPVVGQIRRAFDEAIRKITHGKSRQPARTAAGAGEFVYLQNYPLLSWYVIYDELVRAISRAKRYIYITTPFFAPNRRFRRLLAEAALRGVEVMLLVPQRSEYALIDWICLSYSGRLLRAGVRIFHYLPFMLHGKTVVIDDEWATVGSTNMDIISFFRNRESNLVITDKNAVMELKQHFTADMQCSEELTMEQLRRQPLWKKCVGYAARLVRSFV